MIELFTLASWVLVAVASMAALYGVGIVLTEHKLYPSWFAVLERSDRRQKRLGLQPELKKQLSIMREMGADELVSNLEAVNEKETSHAWVLKGGCLYADWPGHTCLVCDAK